MIKIYFDTCSLNRPFDDQTYVRIFLEAEAVSAILQMCEEGNVALVSSQILVSETGRNPFIERRKSIEAILNFAENEVSLSETILHRARELQGYGIKPADTLHLASAEWAEVDYFCTCDDRFLKKAKERASIKVVSPLELAQEIE